MYLEGLQIHGFKSFGRKTKFRFTDGITSIVGPNGCGKSNIVDAIRWVLGEQKAGIIRSERMENVIFNGSKTLKPLGMADVSLTIHNTKNVLPIEFSEVVITRRLFRSGESQYLLNNAACRLKDIQNLFMDTGMGPDAYSIIELSMVESILNGKADDRRRIFEEAAGVTKYKLRRRAAFRKLEATGGDILRLNDIISEVEKNVGSLKRQVRKAQRYQDFKEVEREKEIQLGSHEFSRIQHQLAPLIEQLRNSTDERAALVGQFDEEEARIEESRVKLLAIERKLSTQQRDLNELSLKIQKREEQILVDRERRKALQDTRVRLQRDREETKARIERIASQVELAKEGLQELFEKIQFAENDFQEKNASLNAKEKNVQDQHERRSNIETQRLQFMEGITKNKQEEERLKTQLENIDARVEQIDREFNENDILENLRQDKIAKLVANKSRTESKIEQLKREHTELQKRIESLHEKKEAQREHILGSRSELQTLKERIELLKKFIESYEDHPEGVQHLLMKGHLNGGCKGTLAEILTVESPYRRAIETALGEAAVSLIVEETEQALRCIEVLKSDEKGSVTFFPMDRFSKGGKLDSEKILISKNSDGIIDWASNLVQCKNDFQPVVSSLLGDYLVVSNLDAARRHGGRLREHRVNLITLGGEILSTWGPIKGGANGSAQAGVIGRKALVEELASKFKSWFKELEKQEKQQEKLEVDYQEAFKTEQELSGELKAAEARLTQEEIALAQKNFESRKEQEGRERLLKEKAAHEKSQTALAEKIAAIAPSLEASRDNRAKYDTELQEVSEQIGELEHELTDCRSIVQDSRVKLVDLKGEERRLQEEVARQQEFERELRQSLVRIDGEMQTAETEASDLDERIAANKNVIEQDFSKHRELDAEVHEIEKAFLDGKQKLESREKSVREIRNQKDEVSETLHGVELRTSELKMQAAQIAERLEAEYDVKVENQQVDEDLDAGALSAEIARLKERITAMEPVNLLALKEYEKEKSRLEFLTSQKNDLLDAESNLQQTINVINKTARAQFNETFEKIQTNFREVFQGFFESGKADLKLASHGDPLEAEILIEADPKGRRLDALSLLSGGEKALTAISLLFAIYLVKPSPFCILDEVDAPLDDANIGRFISAVRKFADDTQFMMVTHNKLTMRAANCLYGVTMEEEGVSKVVSVNFTDMDLEGETAKAA